MLLMASEIARLPRALLHDYPGNGVAFFVADMLEHREWVGVTPWDLIQPSFMFMVGVALPFSVASRRERGHAFGRAVPPRAAGARCSWSLLGIFLRSQGTPADLLHLRGRADADRAGLPVPVPAGVGASALAGGRGGGDPDRLLGGVRALSAAAAGLRLDVGRRAGRTGRTTCPGSPRTGTRTPTSRQAVDVWFLNLFPRESPFRFNGGGYLTLNFVPSLATMIFGLLAGGLVQGRAARAGRRRGGSPRGAPPASSLGLLLHVAGVCPLVKRIWTPSWAIFSAGWAALFLAGWYAAIDLRGWTRAAPSRSSSSA